MERCWGMWMEDKEDQGGKFILSKIQLDMYFITIEMTMISYMRKKNSCEQKYRCNSVSVKSHHFSVIYPFAYTCAFGE